MLKSKIIVCTGFIGLGWFKLKISIFFLVVPSCCLSQLEDKTICSKIILVVLSSWTLLKWELKPKPHATENLVFLPQTLGMSGLRSDQTNIRVSQVGYHFYLKLALWRRFLKSTGPGSVPQTMSYFSLGFRSTVQTQDIQRALHCLGWVTISELDKHEI